MVFLRGNQFPSRMGMTGSMSDPAATALTQARVHPRSVANKDAVKVRQVSIDPSFFPGH